MGIDGLQTGYLGQGVTGNVVGNADFKILTVVGELEDLLQLASVVAEVALLSHNIILVGSALGAELGEVGLAELPYLDHLLTALFVGLAILQTLAVDLQGLVGVENLDVDLRNLLLDGVGGDGGVELGLLFGELVLLDLHAVLVAVPYRPVEAHGVGSVVIDLVGSHLHIAIGNLLAPVLGEGVVGDVLGGRGRKRRQQFSLRLQHVLMG